MRYTLLLFLIIFLAGLLLPQVSLAAHTYTACRSIDVQGNCIGEVEVCYEGLVPCGLGKPYWEGTIGADGNCQGTKVEKGVTCQFCHFFVMFDGIVDFVLRYIVPPVAVLMLVIGGIMFYFAGGNPSLVTRGKNLIMAVIIGLFLTYGAFMLIGTVLKIIGVADWTGLRDFINNGIFTINCKIEL